MQVVGCDDREEIDGIRTRGFGGDQRVEIGIGPVGGDAIMRASLFGSRGIAAECASDKGDLAVQFRGDAMHRADERAGAAAHHRHFQLRHAYAPTTI